MVSVGQAGKGGVMPGSGGGYGEAPGTKPRATGGNAGDNVARTVGTVLGSECGVDALAHGVGRRCKHFFSTKTAMTPRVALVSGTMITMIITRQTDESEQFASDSQTETVMRARELGTQRGTWL